MTKARYYSNSLWLFGGGDWLAVVDGSPGAPPSVRNQEERVGLHSLVGKTTAKFKKPKPCFWVGHCNGYNTNTVRLPVGSQVRPSTLWVALPRVQVIRLGGTSIVYRCIVRKDIQPRITSSESNPNPIYAPSRMHPSIRLSVWSCSNGRSTRASHILPIELPIIISPVQHRQLWQFSHCTQQSNGQW